MAHSVTGYGQPQIRRPAVAGAFYPDDQDKLAAMVKGFLSSQQTPDQPRILIVPHAGYSYSGQVAGTGISQLKPALDKVILLGGSHYEHFSGAALYRGDFWQTPLGQVAVDKDTVDTLLRETPAFFVGNKIHMREHGLEVELPFLQQVLAGFRIVPVLLSRVSSELLDTVSRALTAIIDGKTLLVVSSDLSHYPRQADAEIIDRKTIQAILSGDVSLFQTTINALLKSNVPNLVTCACGAAAIAVGMKIAQALRLTDIRLLRYANSGEANHDESRVVGYAAVGFYETI